MRRSVGLYIGENVVSAAVVENKGEVRFSMVNTSSLEGEEKEVLSKNIILETMVNKCMREIGVEEEEIFVSLADKDFIFRCIDFPLMSKQEVESALMFEIEKYVPFKIKDLIWDYSLIKSSAEKKIKASFLAIRNNIYQEYMNIFPELNLSVKNVEPSSVSLARLMKSIRSVRKIDSFILLDFAESESYITFFYKDLPIFNRYLTITLSEGNINVDKLSEEVRVSIQYFRREFRTYELTRLFVLCREDMKTYFSTLSKYTDSEVTVITPEEILKRDDATVEYLKAYAVASTPFIYYRFRPLLKKEGEGKKAKEEIFSFAPWNVPLLAGVSIVGMVVCIFLSIMLNNSLSLKRYELKKMEEKIAMPSQIKNMSVDKLKKYIVERKNLLENMKEKLQQADKVAPLLEKLPLVLGKGVWLTGFSLSNADSGYILEITGYVFRGDLDEARRGLDEFIDNLREDEVFSKLFTKISLLSSEKASFEGIDVLAFSLKLSK